MGKEVVFVGIDVDDKMFHGFGINSVTGECHNFVSKPTAGDLIKRLEKIKEEGVEIRTCYEATYIGYTLQRALAKAGYNCEVAAPSLIPRKPGKKVKTDRIDSEALASYYLKGELTMVHVPEEREERIRDMIRGRNFLKKQSKRLKQFILSQCRRSGLNYKEEIGKTKSYWTQSHLIWLEREINKRGEELKYTLQSLLMHLEELNNQISGYDNEIEKISKREEYKERVSGLQCYRGIGVLTAMTIITELGDIRRFDHPRRLTSYSGLDLIEYSSGGKEARYGISKMGNRHIRTSVVEACQTANRIPFISRKLKLSRKGAKVEYIEIADRCMRRLHKKWHRMQYAGKNNNVIKTACAREMLSFVWETLRAAA